MLQVHETYNMTPFPAKFAFSMNNEGQDLLVGILKASFDFDENGAMSISPRERILPIMLSDEFYGKAENSGLRYPADIVPEKEGTDIIINGTVYGNNQRQVQCGFTLGHLKKTLIVSGRRTWSRKFGFTKLSAPLPFDKIPVTYENAFGGRREDKNGVQHFEYNPVGIGFGADPLENPVLPSIEYMDCLIKSIGDRPKPAGLCAIPMSWKQRLMYAGTYDDTWKNQRFPLAPLDLNPRFYNAVPDDQIFRPKLKGQEELTLYNLHCSNTEFKLNIPGHTFICTARIKQETIPHTMEIDTCLIEPDEQRLTLTYISRIPHYSDNKYLKSIHFEEKVLHYD
jgi:hypothetical protein